jgi:P4 family phage/plasmid primase-like protien
VHALRARIADAVGGDPAFGSLHQPIRVAGTIHGKGGIRTPVRILERSGLEFELGDLEEAMGTMPTLMAAPDRSFSLDVGPPAPSAAELATRTIRAGGVDGETRFGALSRVMGHWIRTARDGRTSLETAWEAVRDHNAAVIAPPWDEGRLRREFEALLRRDIDRNGPIADTGGARQPGAPVSDDALATMFVATHGDDWRHVASWGTWFRWSGRRWVRDETALVRECVRQVCRAAVGPDVTRGEERRIRSDRTIAAVTRIAASDPALAMRASDWDAHPMLLNTPDGVVDLATGAVRANERDLLLTQITAASPGSGCALWSAFLDQVTGGDRDLQSYLQRLAGYILTGSTCEQIFAFLHGSGANGKSVFLQTLGAVLGDYAATATLDTFMAAQASRHLTELAGLRAARLVIVPETEAGRSWAEARIKAVTGGEKIRANFMHRDHFEYTPQFKLVVAGNHRPSLSGVGEAMRRRLHLVPFEVTIPPDQRDRDLPARLLAERDGILGWMLEGCAAWQRTGLAPPPCVVEAGTSYFAEEDLAGQWIEEACEVGPELAATSRALFASWSSWAAAGGHAAGTQKSLGDALKSRGFVAGKIARARGWNGLRPRGSATAQEREA